MEDDLQTVVVGIGEDGLVEAQRLLLVATKEIHLDAGYAVVAQPTHLSLTTDGAVHTLTGTLRGIVPATVGIVPNPRPYTLLLAVVEEFLHTVALDVLIPAAIDEAAFPTEGGGEVDIGDLVVVVDAGVLPDNPRPGVARALVIGAGFIERLHDIPRNRSFNNRFQRRAKSQCTPRRYTYITTIGRTLGIGKSHLRARAAEAVVFARHREGDGHETAGSGVAEVAAAVVAGSAGLANQQPRNAFSVFGL